MPQATTRIVPKRPSSSNDYDTRKNKVVQNKAQFSATRKGQDGRLPTPERLPFRVEARWLGIGENVQLPHDCLPLSTHEAAYGPLACPERPWRVHPMLWVFLVFIITVVVRALVILAAVVFAPTVIDYRILLVLIHFGPLPMGPGQHTKDCFI